MRKVTLTKMFHIKFEFHYRTFYVLLNAFIFVLVYFGFTLRLLERTYTSDTVAALNYEYIGNARWLVIETMTSVGYGDAYPSTHLGRVWACALGVGGSLFLSLCVWMGRKKSQFTKS